MITPFQMGPPSSNEVQTDDRISLGLGGHFRNTLSSEQVSKQGSAFPDSSRNAELTKKAIPDLSKPRQDEAVTGCSRLKVSLLLITSAAFVFGACTNAFFLFNATDEGVRFILLTLAAAVVADVAIQTVILLALSAVHMVAALRQKELAATTVMLESLTTTALELSNRVFVEYQAHAQLLKVEF